MAHSTPHGLRSTAKVSGTPVDDPSTSAADDAPYPLHSASEAPVRRMDRIAFQVWVVCVLLSVAITLVFYLVDKLYFAQG